MVLLSVHTMVIPLINTKADLFFLGRRLRCAAFEQTLNNIYMKQKWEKEMNVEITEEMWDTMWETQISSTHLLT